MKQNRRNFLAMTGMAAMGVASLNQTLFSQVNPNKKVKKAPFELGIASYTFRSFDLTQTLAMTKQVGIKEISFKSMHLPLESRPEQISKVIEQAGEAGIHVYGGGVIYMKDEAQVLQAFDYAKAAGFETIIGVPNHELLDLVERKVKETNIKVAIHNHGPGDKLYPTPQSIMEKIDGRDGRIGICMDIGHTMRSGIDPAEDIIRYKERVLDLHLKDVSKAEGSGSTVEMGRGVIDLPKVFKALLQIKYSGKASFEYEKDGKNPLPGLAESVGYARGAIDCLL